MAGIPNTVVDFTWHPRMGDNLDELIRISLEFLAAILVDMQDHLLEEIVVQEQDGVQMRAFLHLGDSLRGYFWFSDGPDDFTIEEDDWPVQQISEFFYRWRIGDYYMELPYKVRVWPQGFSMV